MSDMSDKTSRRELSRRELSRQTGLPLPARAFVRAGGEKLFGGFVVAGPELPAPGDQDEIWEVEITFRRMLSRGTEAHDQRLDQVMTGPYLADPSTLKSQNAPRK